MPRVSVSGIELEYESFGSGEPLLLIMGLGAQMILWPEEFCKRLSSFGFQVIRFDNRDIGLSTHAEGAAPVGQLLLSHLLNRKAWRRPPYTLDDMADDSVGLLAALGIQRAHIVGASMGGMIAQLIAIRHPERIRSLGLIMTHPGGRWLGTPSALLTLVGPRGKDRESVIRSNVRLLQTIAGTLPVEEAHLRTLAETAYDRSYHPAGFFRQFAAILAASDRSADLARLTTPTVVLHGTADPLVPLRAGKALASSIPDSRFVEVAGMGHSLPMAAWPTLFDGLVENARRSVKEQPCSSASSSQR